MLLLVLIWRHLNRQIYLDDEAFVARMPAKCDGLLLSRTFRARSPSRTRGKAGPEGAGNHKPRYP